LKGIFWGATYVQRMYSECTGSLIQVSPQVGYSVQRLISRTIKYVCGEKHSYSIAPLYYGHPQMMSLIERCPDYRGQIE
jgi:hypothetical protein